MSLVEIKDGMIHLPGGTLVDPTTRPSYISATFSGVETDAKRVAIPFDCFFMGDNLGGEFYDQEIVGEFLNGEHVLVAQCDSQCAAYVTRLGYEPVLVKTYARHALGPIVGALNPGVAINCRRQLSVRISKGQSGESPDQHYIYATVPSIATGACLTEIYVFRGHFTWDGTSTVTVDNELNPDADLFDDKGGWPGFFYGGSVTIKPVCEGPPTIPGGKTNDTGVETCPPPPTGSGGTGSGSGSGSGGTGGDSGGGGSGGSGSGSGGGDPPDPPGSGGSGGSGGTGSGSGGPYDCVSCSTTCCVSSKSSRTISTEDVILDEPTGITFFEYYPDWEYPLNCTMKPIFDEDSGEFYGSYESDPGPVQSYTSDGHYFSYWRMKAAAFCRGDGGYPYVTIVQEEPEPLYEYRTTPPDETTEWTVTHESVLEIQEHNAGGQVNPDENNCVYWFGWCQISSGPGVYIYVRTAIVNNNCCHLPGTGCIKAPTTQADGFCDE